MRILEPKIPRIVAAAVLMTALWLVLRSYELTPFVSTLAIFIATTSASIVLSGWKRQS